ncbi:MAG: hypothetical protein II339_02145 [Spirochaetales bacterium]|nr:hypothetical protein [Spirochaetales bacterium]
MRKHDKAICISLFMLILAIAFIQGFRWFPFNDIEEINYSEASTRTIRELSSSLLYRNYFSVSKIKLTKSLESLSYVDRVNYEFKDGVLYLHVEMPSQALILKDSKGAFLWDGETLRSFGLNDYSDLAARYLTIEIDDDYLDYLNRYGIEGKFESLAGSIFDLGDYSALISKAEYDNNNYTGTGKLTLFLDQLNAELSLSDIQSIARLEDSLEAIEREVGKNPIKALNEPKALYELRLSELVRIKR